MECIVIHEGFSFKLQHFLRKWLMQLKEIPLFPTFHYNRINQTTFISTVSSICLIDSSTETIRKQVIFRDDITYSRLASPLLRVEWNFFYNYIYKYEFAYKHPRSLIKTYSSIFFREVIRIFIRKARFLPFSKLE